MEIIQYAVLLLCTIGEMIALYFSLATYEVIREDLIASLPVCNVHGKKERIVDTFYGRVFYLPNSVYGMLFYLLIFIYTLVVWDHRNFALDIGILGLSLGVLVLSIYLYWALRKRLFTVCKLCITTQLLNTGIFLLLGWRYLLQY